MKKFIKYGTIAGCVLILCGAGIGTAAFALGADPVRIWDFFGDKFEGSDRYEKSWDSATLNETTVAWERIESPVNEAEGTTRPYRDAVMESVYGEVTDLDVQVSDGIVEFYQDSELVNLIVTSDNGTKDNLRYSVLEHRAKLEIFVFDGEEYRIGIPADWELEDIEVETLGGTFYGDGVRAKNAEYSTLSGAITVRQFGGKKTSLESKGGIIEWDSEGEVPGHLDIESTDSGMVYVGFGQEIAVERIGYDMEYNDGAITFYEEFRDGVGEEHRKAQDGMPLLEMEAERGGTIIVR